MKTKVCWAAAIAVLSVLAITVPVPAQADVCPGPVVIDGIDVSYWQQNIDWAKVKAAGKKYAIMRAAHAMKVDTKFDYNWKECHAKGLHCGVYQFFEPAEDPIKQADLMLSMMGKLGPDDLPPVIDVESAAGSTPSQTAAAVGKWIAHVEKTTGVKPMIYTGFYFWKDNVGSNAFATYPLWHPQYTSASCPTIAAPWTTWHFWQHSSTGSVLGISGNVDLNRWNGDAAALAKFAVQPSGCTPGCQGNAVVQANCAKSDCGVGKCVSDSLGVRCIDAACPSQGQAKVCVDSSVLAECQNGKIGATSDCSATAGLCNSAAASQAKCVSTFCVSSSTAKPVAKDLCLKDGKRYSCSAAGDLSLKDCPAGSTCSDDGSGAVCKSKTCAKACEGNLLVGADCGKIDCAGLPGLQAGSCVNDASGARCVSKHCPASGNVSVCLPAISPAALGICSAGSLVPATCKIGLEVCQMQSGGASCQAMAGEDAMSGDSAGAADVDAAVGNSEVQGGEVSESDAPTASADGEGEGDGSLSGEDGSGTPPSLLMSPQDDGGCNSGKTGSSSGWMVALGVLAWLVRARRRVLET